MTKFCDFDIKKQLSHPLFVKIRSEHKEIWEIAQNLLSDPYMGNQLLQKLKGHHLKEERFIFRQIKDHPRLSEGGPMCTYFYDEQIHSPPLSIAKDLLGEEILWRDDQQDLVKTSSPLLIPLGEHRAIISLLSFLINRQGDEKLRAKVNRELLRILKSNIQKEENCFFKVCIKLLGYDGLNQADQDWQKNLSIK